MRALRIILSERTRTNMPCPSLAPPAAPSSDLMTLLANASHGRTLHSQPEDNSTIIVLYKGWMKSNNVPVAVVQDLDSYNTLYWQALMMMGSTVVYCCVLSPYVHMCHTYMQGQWRWTDGTAPGLSDDIKQLSNARLDNYGNARV